MSADAKPGPLQKLVDSFHSLLEESLILAIANDFDLDTSSGYEAAHAVLGDLSQCVPSEEASGFDPSALNGFAGLDMAADERDGRARTGSAAETTASSEQTPSLQDQKTDSASSSNSSSHGSGCDAPRISVVNNQSEESKIKQLQELFPDVKAYDVKYSLTKAKGHMQTALDDLLSIQYLESTGQRAKGIDGFCNGESLPTGSKKKGKGSLADRSSDNRGSGSGRPSLFSASNDPRGQGEIAYLAERFNIPFDEVSALYYEASCSSVAVMLQILDENLDNLSHGESSAPVEAQKNQELVIESLRAKYRTIPDKYIQAIVQTTGTVPRFSDDIAALANKHFKRIKKQRLDTSYTLKPLPAEDLETAETGDLGYPTLGGRGGKTVPSTTSSSSQELKNYAEALAKSKACHQARRDAIASATSLYRKGASDPLYRQAASVYKQRASEQAGYAQEAMSTAADLLVQEQSTEDSIDLHGVSVSDGVRIARQGARDWWETRGKFRGEWGDSRTLTVITGLGRHSASGVSQLRQCVAKALAQDGWKTKVETGKFVITGRQ